MEGIINAAGVTSVNGSIGDTILKTTDVIASGEADQYAKIWIDESAEDSGTSLIADDSLKLNGKAPEYYIQPVNLLDNSDFANPVNQRGQTRYIGIGYSIDRWHLWATANTLDVVNGGIQYSDAFVQHLEHNKIISGNRYTVAVWLADGTVYCRSGIADDTGETLIGDWSNARLYYANNMWYFVMQANFVGKTVSRAALYEGTYTAETLPPYRPKGYAAELAECQRYYCKLYGTGCGTAHMYTNLDAYIFLSLPTKMRITPTIQIEKLKITSGENYFPSFIDMSSVDNIHVTDTGLSFFAHISREIPSGAGKDYLVATEQCSISADL